MQQSTLLERPSPLIMNLSQKVKTPFRYPGGKFYALSYILPYIENVEHVEYREAFVGGGSVFFGKRKAAHNWINDIDLALTNTYETIQDPKLCLALVQRVSAEFANRERYAEVKKMLAETNFEKAFKYYYMNRTSYSGKMISPSWGYREKRSIPPNRWHEVLMPAHHKLQNVKITSLDFQEVIEAPATHGNVLLYLDPPYFLPPKTKHYVNGFHMEDHLRMADSLKKTSHTFFVSYEDCDEVRDLYNWANIYDFGFAYRVGDSNTSEFKRKTGREVLISNVKFTRTEQLSFLS